MRPDDNREPFSVVNSINGISYLRIPEFERYGNVKTFFTTRIGGVSTGEFSSLNYGGNTTDNPDNVTENRKRIFSALGISGFKQVYLNQVHGCNVYCIKADAIPSTEEIIIPDADGIITDSENLLITTLHADCLPLFFYDSEKNVIAVSHAGWRGTAKRIGEITIRKMQDVFGCVPENITAAVGPGIGKCCFEVGADVIEEFSKSFNRIDTCYEKKSGGKYMLDLKKINMLQLTDAGVKNILVSNYCTKCYEELFFSYRRDGGRTGRMGAGMILTEKQTDSSALRESI